MIKIENVDIYGWEAAIRGARNPMNSWDRTDTTFFNEGAPKLGPYDYRLLKNLASAGPDHGKFMRMISVTMDITCHQVWWAEFDTYKVGTIRNSCSKMHKIHVKPFELDDFSHEGCDEVSFAKKAFIEVVAACEHLRQKFNETHEKKYWRALVELLPEGYNMRATISLNYQVLKSMYHARRSHKLDEWREFCRWVESLPYSELITDG